MKRIYFLVLVFSLIAFISGWYYHDFLYNGAKTNILTDKQSGPETKRPLEKYTIENLTKENFVIGEFTIEKELEKENTFTSYSFSYKFDSDLDMLLDKTTTGVINLPNVKSIYPVILMLRGYVDQNIYQQGAGSKNAAFYLSQNGYITVAPDFLGYAQSDIETENIFESRFQTYITAISLLNYLQSISKVNYSGDEWLIGNIGIWGHSNGGQIALTVLEATMYNIPTVIWAPVSKPFPYSILYYTDESEDKGKLIRSELAKFEQLYDVEKYSLTNYLQNIKTSIQIHQGTNDDAVPLEWSNQLSNNLKAYDIDFEYFTYPGADHNLRPTWDTAISRTLIFFNKNIKN